MPKAPAPNFINVAIGPVIATIVIVIVGWIVFKMFSKVYNRIARRVWAWDKLAQTFPPLHVRKTGDLYHGGGFIGGRMRFTFYGRAKPFAIEPSQQGLMITPTFAPDAPILIPWTAIREASWVDSLASVLTLTIENERTLQFYLPREAVPIVEENIPGNRFHKDTLAGLLGQAAPSRAGE